ncbi:hypothetical protein [Pseudonocardia sp. T1-2H]|uniref:hypothetical protein n=1 Tax=Pseudonocardia sp. T1-2H TaxID=3128899 RepID=UPI003101A9F3
MTDQTDPPARLALASAYQAECLAMCNRLRREGPYSPNYAYRALASRIPLEAVAYIAQTITKGSEGLRRLAETNQIGDSFEASVLHPRWATLFDEDLRVIARNRLREVATAFPAVAPEVALLLATERIQFDQQLAYELAGMPDFLA